MDTCSAHISIVVQILSSHHCVGNVESIGWKVCHVLLERIALNVDIWTRICHSRVTIRIKVRGYYMDCSSNSADILLKFIVFDNQRTLTFLDHQCAYLFILLHKAVIIKSVSSICQFLEHILANVRIRITNLEIELTTSLFEIWILQLRWSQVLLWLDIFIDVVIFDICHILGESVTLNLDAAWEAFSIDNKALVIIRFKNAGEEFIQAWSAANCIFLEIWEDF